MAHRLITVVVAVTLAWACGGGGSTHKNPDAAVDAFASTCGFPGDVGNELGIGHFCMVLEDCATIPTAPLCSSFGDPTTHFCTKTCAAAGSDTQCGTATTCSCNSSNQCGCTPNACLGP